MASQLLADHIGRDPNVVVNHPAFIAYEEKNPKYRELIIEGVKGSEAYAIGIEIEIEKVGRNSVERYPIWTPHQDGSLRNGGVEYVTIPIAGPRITYALNQFFDCIGKGFHFSPRTSIHVHLNVLDMPITQIGALGMTYAAFERVLFKFIGGDRDKNNFCVPFYESKGYSWLKTFMSSKDFQIPEAENFRYMAFNLDAIRKFGTVEFRHLGGTADKVRIMNWINLIFCLKRYALNTPLETVKATIDRLNTDSLYQVFCADVFGVHSHLLDRTNLQNDMQAAISSLKTLIIYNTFRKTLSAKVKDAHWYTVLSAKPAVPATTTITFNTDVPRGRQVDATHDGVGWQFGDVDTPVPGTIRWAETTATEALLERARRMEQVAQPRPARPGRRA